MRTLALLTGRPIGYTTESELAPRGASDSVVHWPEPGARPLEQPPEQRPADLRPLIVYTTEFESNQEHHTVEAQGRCDRDGRNGS